MATKAVNLEKQVECPICLEQYKEPKVLSCLHSYCKSCLQKYVTKSSDKQHKIKCPECRQETEVPDGDVGKLQANFWVNNLISLLTITSSDKKQKTLICENCDSGDISTSRCSECCVFMCDFCVKSHQRMHKFKHHQIVSLEEVKSGSPKALIKPVCCEKHGDEVLKLFCQTCEKPICRDCTMVEHRSHDYLFITDVASKEKTFVKQLLEKTKMKVSVLADGVKSVEKMEDQVQARVAAVTQDIESLKEKHIRALEEVFANLKHDAKTIGQAKVKQLQAQRESFMITLASAANSVEFTERILKDGGDVELLSMKNQLVTKLSNLNSTTLMCEPCQKDTMKLTVHQDIWQVAANIATVDDSQVAPEKCTISMVGAETGVIYDTLAGQRREFSVVLRDSQGSSLKGEQVHVTVAKPGALQGTLIKVTDDNDGTYSFSFLPQNEGQYQLNVALSSHHIQGSPFQWNVIPEVLILQQKMRYLDDDDDDEYFRPVPQLLTNLQRCKGVLSWKVKVIKGNSQHNRVVKTKALQLGVSSPMVGQNIIANNGYKCDGRYGRQRSNIKAWEDGDVFVLYLNMNAEKLIIHRLRTSETEVFEENIQGNVSPFLEPHNSSYFSLDVN